MTKLPDLAADPRALDVLKRPLGVAVDFAGADGVCETLEGPVRYRAGDALLTGARGERWPVGRATFDASYAPAPDGPAGTYVKRPRVVRALRLDHALEVPVGWQRDPLHAKPGDWLLAYGDGDFGVVRDDIFRETYAPAAGGVWPPA